MKYVIKGLLILSMVFLAFTAFSNAKAELPKVYVPLATDWLQPGQVPEDIDVLTTSAYWYDINDLHALIDIFEDFGREAADKAFEHYLDKESAVWVNRGYVGVKFSHIYNGWMIFVVDR